jgi:hypothetical protein
LLPERENYSPLYRIPDLHSREPSHTSPTPASVDGCGHRLRSRENFARHAICDVKGSHSTIVLL